MLNQVVQFPKPATLFSVFRHELPGHSIGDDWEIWGDVGLCHCLCLHGGTLPDSPEEHSHRGRFHGIPYRKHLCSVPSLPKYDAVYDL